MTLERGMTESDSAEVVDQEEGGLGEKREN